MELERTVVTKAEIEAMVTRVAGELRAALAGEERPLFVGVMKGSYIWMSDLLRELAGDFDIESDYIDVSSYEDDASTGEIKVVRDVHADMQDRTVVIMDEVIDTGLTLHYLKQDFLNRGAKQVLVAVAADKRSAIDEGGITPDFIGVQVPDEFLVGYGMDYNDHFRNLPTIDVLRLH